MPDLTQGHAPPAYWQQFEDLTVGAARVVFGEWMTRAPLSSSSSPSAKRR